MKVLGCTHFGEDNLKHARIIETYSCHRAGCPVCYESWAFREAENATDRLREGQHAYYEAGIVYSLKHVVFSPDTSRHAELKRMLEHGDYKSIKRYYYSMFCMW